MSSEPRPILTPSLGQTQRSTQLEARLVLLVDDEGEILELLEEALEEAGFPIAVAESGESAVALLESKEAPYGMLVTDVNLRQGGIDGWQLGRRAREIAPEIGVIYITGANASQWAARGVPNSILIPKPFAPAQIVTAVAQLMNITAPPPPGSTSPH